MPAVPGMLRFVVAMALAVAVVAQVVALPWLSGVMADDYPEFAHLRWPLLVAAMLGVACGQVVLVATWRLLGMAAQDAIFTTDAFGWVDRMIAAAFLAGALVVAVFIGLALDDELSHGGLTLALLLLAAAGLSAGLSLVVVRELVCKAATMRSDLADVI